MKFASLFETSFGMGIVVASDRGIQKVYLPYDGTNETIINDGLSSVPTSALSNQVAEMLHQYFMGVQQPFEVIPVDLEMKSAFRIHVLNVIRNIPYGVTKSYGEVAYMSGAPHAARAIGGAMASNPVPIIIPCHRVVSGNGRLTGYTAPGGLETKKKLLQMEGVEFKGELVCQE
jgi:methylated-DNA-[protein]-cysteine S-methyltransferase